ncbi:hypothetical protein [Sphingobacterium hungaricum]
MIYCYKSKSLFPFQPVSQVSTLGVVESLAVPTFIRDEPAAIPSSIFTKATSNVGATYFSINGLLPAITSIFFIYYLPLNNEQLTACNRIAQA